MLERSYNYNYELAEYSSRVGDLDLAERCYKRALCDAMRLEHFRDEMVCIVSISRVYIEWGRYDEVIDNYQYVLKYLPQNDFDDRAVILHDLGAVYQTRYQYAEALKMYDESLSLSSNAITNLSLLARYTKKEHYIRT